MRGRHPVAALLVLATVAIASARFTLQAEDSGKADPAAGAKTVHEGRGGAARPGSDSVQDWLLRPVDFPFREPTSLADVCRFLGRTLEAQVVLDVAALKRLDITRDERVQLELHDVRLKTGLKLLLDQVGMSYRVVPEDNLLVLTDAEGADDPLDRILREMKSIHREVHDLQDAFDDLREDLGYEDGARMRKPTIIEEMPDDPNAKPTAPPTSTPGRPRS